jgi:membrane-bound ClpP family serine protease
MVQYQYDDQIGDDQTTRRLEGAAMNVLDDTSLAILALVLGCVLLVSEVFIPSSGLLGILSGAGFLLAIYFAFRDGGITFAIGTVAIEVLLIPVLLGVALKYLPYTPIGKVLLGEPPKEEDVAVEDPRRALVGKIGVARSKMLPSGSVEIDGHMLDAVSQGQAIEPGQYVKVVEVRANRVVVRIAPADARPRDVNPSDLLTRPATELGLDDDPLA